MHYLVVGFLVMLGAMAAVASAPMIFAVAIVAVKGLLILLATGVIAGVVWFRRLPNRNSSREDRAACGLPGSMAQPNQA
jgi:membrane protein implicated in regulation of membrane protease activity